MPNNGPSRKRTKYNTYLPPMIAQLVKKQGLNRKPITNNNALKTHNNNTRLANVILVATARPIGQPGYTNNKVIRNRRMAYARNLLTMVYQINNNARKQRVLNIIKVYLNNNPRYRPKTKF